MKALLFKAIGVPLILAGLGTAFFSRNLGIELTPMQYKIVGFSMTGVGIILVLAARRQKKKKEQEK